jgi:hypothetical protein
MSLWLMGAGVQLVDRVIAMDGIHCSMTSLFVIGAGRLILQWRDTLSQSRYTVLLVAGKIVSSCSVIIDILADDPDIKRRWWCRAHNADVYELLELARGQCLCSAN